MKKKEMLKKKALKVMTELIEVSTKEYLEEWPPHCTLILHQPTRPQKKNK